VTFIRKRLIFRQLASCLIVTSIPSLVLAQTSPFETGANSLVTFATTIGTPIAVLVIIGLAIVAAVGKISWGWVIGAIVGIAAIFGAPTIVTWIRSMFGV
jgi:type IV secretion system protein VirB2